MQVLSHSLCSSVRTKLQIRHMPLPLQDDLIGFRVGIPLDGDIVIALWFGNIVRETDTPAFTYAFHTAFVGSGLP